MRHPLGGLGLAQAVVQRAVEVEGQLRSLALGDQRGDGDQAAVAGAEGVLAPQVREQHFIGVARELRGHAADTLGIQRPTVSQPLYNIVNRVAEVEQLPVAGHYGIGVVPYSPLGRGVLSGKYAVNAPPPADTRAGRGDKRIQQTEWRPESLKIAKAIAEHAATRGTTSVAFAIAWVLKNRLISAAIAGPRTEAQWDSYLEALDLELGPEDEALVDSLVVPGHASTHGFTDPGYPVEGRKVS